MFIDNVTKAYEKPKSNNASNLQSSQFSLLSTSDPPATAIKNTGHISPNYD